MAVGSKLRIATSSIVVFILLNFSPGKLPRHNRFSTPCIQSIPNQSDDSFHETEEYLNQAEPDEYSVQLHQLSSLQTTISLTNHHPLQKCLSLLPFSTCE